MPRGNSSSQTHEYALPEELHIGLYIHIDLPWFLHPFTLNCFKISTDEQIRQLRALNVRHFRYDPERSESAPGGASAVLPAEPAAPVAEPTAEIDSAPAAETVGIDPHVRRLREHSDAVARAEKSFVKAAGIMRRLNRNLLSQPSDTLEEMGGLVDRMATVFLDRPEASLHVMGANCGGEDAYHHSLNVSILCMMLVKGLELTSEQAGVLGRGALLHDIGAIALPASGMSKSDGVQTWSERDLPARQVEYGLKLGKQLGLAPEILCIIEQHHELGDGTGYPRGIRLEQIAPLARIVALANFYDTLCNPADFVQALTPHEALSYIFTRRKGQFDARVLQLMIRSLGVYPPGSVVELSNGMIAMVVSVNPHKSLRPWVMVYDAAVPKEEAAMFNLEMQADLIISKSIRPALLPAPVYAYLSPRKRITYFFDGGCAKSGEHA